MAPWETQLDASLRAPEPSIPDDGFSQRVMRALAAKRAPNTRAAARWTLGGTAVAGGVLVSWIGAPIDSVMGSSALGTAYATSIFGALLVAIVAVPMAWVLHAE
jgi:hypothetical protein